MRTTSNYAAMIRSIGSAFRKRYSATERFPIRMVALVFARPEQKMTREYIIPSLPYFDRRSGNHIDFFFPGYCSTIHGRKPPGGDYSLVTTLDKRDWYFSRSRFLGFKKTMRTKSAWRASGDVELMLLNAEYDCDTKKVTLDFGSAVICVLDEMMNCGAIRSIDSYFEDIIRFAEEYTGTTPTWDYSEKKGLEVAGSALKRVLLSLLPRGLSKEVSQSAHFAVRDIAPTS